MTALDGKPVRIMAPYHFEANELNVINGKFVYTYCSNWAERKDADWNSYCKEYGVSQPKPGACTMCYMVSDNPMDAGSWVYKGVYGEHPGMPSPNNHSHLHKFKGNYYYIYHWGALMKKMKDDGVLDGSCDGFRSICVNKATVSESSQKINSVSMDLVGVDAIGSVNPYQLQEAEMMATSAGISYEDFTNITRNTRISTLGNDASQNMQVKMAEGAWIQVRRVNFGSAGAAKFTVRAKGEGTLELRLSRKVAKPVATIEISADEMTDFTVDLDAAKIKDQKTVYLVLSSGKGIYFDAWQATEAQTEGISSVESHNAINRQRYDLSGRRLSDTEQHRGIVIEQYTDENGKKHIRKTF
jgi:arabinoxylan arabinofuranohydrolase